jgi:hypothetical protein
VGVAKSRQRNGDFGFEWISFVNGCFKRESGAITAVEILVAEAGSESQ